MQLMKKHKVQKKNISRLNKVIKNMNVVNIAGRGINNTDIQRTNSKTINNIDIKLIIGKANHNIDIKTDIYIKKFYIQQICNPTLWLF